jgi:hypothetical protein
MQGVMLDLHRDRLVPLKGRMRTDQRFAKIAGSDFQHRAQRDGLDGLSDDLLSSGQKKRGEREAGSRAGCAIGMLLAMFSQRDFANTV